MTLLFLASLCRALTCRNVVALSYSSNQVSNSISAGSDLCYVFLARNVVASINQMGSATAGVYESPTYSTTSFGSYTSLKTLTSSVPYRVVHFSSADYGLIRFYSQSSTTVSISYSTVKSSCDILTVSNKMNANFTLPFNSSYTVLSGTDYCFFYAGYGSAYAYMMFTKQNSGDSAVYYQDDTAFQITSNSAATYSMLSRYPLLIDVYNQYSTTGQLLVATVTAVSSELSTITEGTFFSLSSSAFLLTNSSNLDGGSTYSTSSSSGLSDGAILGIAAAAFVIFFLAVFFCSYCCCRHMRRTKVHAKESSSCDGQTATTVIVQGGAYPQPPNCGPQGRMPVYPAQYAGPQPQYQAPYPPAPPVYPPPQPYAPQYVQQPGYPPQQTVYPPQQGYPMYL